MKPPRLLLCLVFLLLSFEVVVAQGSIKEFLERTFQEQSLGKCRLVHLEVSPLREGVFGDHEIKGSSLAGTLEPLEDCKWVSFPNAATEQKGFNMKPIPARNTGGSAMRELNGMLMENMNNPGTDLKRGQRRSFTGNVTYIRKNGEWLLNNFTVFRGGDGTLPVEYRQPAAVQKAPRFQDQLTRFPDAPPPVSPASGNLFNTPFNSPPTNSEPSSFSIRNLLETMSEKKAKQAPKGKTRQVSLVNVCDQELNIVYPTLNKEIRLGPKTKGTIELPLGQRIEVLVKSESSEYRSSTVLADHMTEFKISDRRLPPVLVLKPGELSSDDLTGF